MIDSLLSSILADFGNEMDPYVEMLRARRDKMISLINERMQQAVQSVTPSVRELDAIFHDALPIVAEMDEDRWNELRTHRDLAVKRLRNKARQALASEASLDAVDAILEEAQGCRHEMPEEWNELQEHRAYLLEESGYAVLASQHLLQRRADTGGSGYTPDDFGLIEDKIAHLESYVRH
eukprot:SAG31_NODE_1129_length_9755_cov_2.095070_10_plen_179_part_00